jgi:hypothetical protein
MKDAKVEILERLLNLAQLIRRKGTPEQAEAVLPYERQLQHDLQVRQDELAQLPGLDSDHKAVAA